MPEECRCARANRATGLLLIVKGMVKIFKMLQSGRELVIGLETALRRRRIS